MTEKEWNECGDIKQMLEFVKGERKLRLFACACARQNWHLLSDDRFKQAVIIAEQFSDGLVSKEKLDEAWSDADIAWAAEDASYWSADITWSAAAVAADIATWTAAWSADDTCCHAAYWAEVDAYLAANNVVNGFTTYIPLLKDIFDPFNKYKQPHCNNYTKQFARTIYENPNEKGELLDLHVLADMLIDQNVDQVLVDHLRSGVHVRGCQVLDLVMHN